MALDAFRPLSSKVEVEAPSTSSLIENAARFLYTPDNLDKIFQQEVLSFLKAGEAKAFFTYRALVPSDLIRDIEECLHHGWSHIRRVMIHSRSNQMDGVKHREDQDYVQDLLQFANATTLTERLHDLIQQHLNKFKGENGERKYEKDSKTLHAEIGALHLMLLSPELTQLGGYTTEDIYFAAFMTYFHSDPERIRSQKTLPTFAELRNWIIEQIAKKHADKKKIPESLIDFLPVPPGLTKEEFALRLKDDTHFEAPQLDEKTQELLLFFAERFAIADKTDALAPPDKANFRSIETFRTRDLFISITPEAAERIFKENLNSIDSKINISPSVQLYEQRNTVSRLQIRVQKAFKEEDVLPPSLEYELRLVAGELISPDDFSRVIYESTRNYDDLHLTQYERAKIGQSLQERLIHFMQIAATVAGTESNGKIKEALEKKNLEKKLEPASLTNMQQMVKFAVAQIAQLYDKSMWAQEIDPLNGKQYDAGKRDVTEALLMYSRVMENSSERTRYIQ